MLGQNTFSLEAYEQNGACFAFKKHAVHERDKIGVILLSHGEPEGRDLVQEYLYDVYRDPNITDTPFKGWLRTFWARFYSHRRAADLREGLNHTGGAAAFLQLKEDQRKALSDVLRQRMGSVLGVEFVVELSNSYGRNTHAQVIAGLVERGIKKVILLPLYPQFGRSTTGATLVRFRAAFEAAGRPFDCSLIPEFSAHPKLIRALNERIDEALQRFPKEVRSGVECIFSAHSIAASDYRKKGDPFLYLVHETVRGLKKLRAERRPFHTAFGTRSLFANRYVRPWTTDVIQDVAKSDKQAILIVPISYVHDHFETDYTMDNVYRKFASKNGIRHFEVTTGLNCHELFIEALSDIVASRLEPARYAHLTKPNESWKPLRANDRTFWMQKWETDYIESWIESRQAS